MRRAHVALAVVLSLLVSTSATAAIPQLERDVLLTLYQTTHGADWGRNGGWNGAPGSECSWYGITCDDTQSAVIGIDLGFNNVAGPIPPELRNLQKLQSLDLTANPLTGTFPIELTQISSLRSLRLGEFYGKPLGGTIPKELAQLTNLRALDLSGNALTGSIPQELTNLPNLQELILGINQLSGPIPTAFFQSSTLTRLDLYYNGLTGTLPPQISMPNVVYIDLSSNLLSGAIPPSLGTSSKLKSLYLNGNQLSGSIPKELGQLTELEDLVLAQNQLSGPLPQEFGALTHLVRFNAGSNPISGPIPDIFGPLTALQTLALYDTSLSGEVPASLFTLPAVRDLYLSYHDSSLPHLSGRLIDFTRLTTLHTLDLAGNFTGPIPPEISRLSALEEVRLSECPLGGSIPAEIGALTNLARLDLDDTGISGPLPETFGNLAALARLVARNNHLTSLPASFGNLGSMRTLYLSSNDLSGPVPASLGRLSKLEDLVLDDNRFSGSIPPEIFQIPSLVDIDLSHNELTGTIPPAGALTKLQSLKLSANQLTGPIPSDLGSDAMVTLDLSLNRLSGPIPPAVAALPALYRLALEDNDLTGSIPDLAAASLVDLTLSRNHFSGPIPHSLGRLVKLNYADLGQNKLSGQIPAEIAALTALGDNYLGLADNALYNEDPSIRDFLAKKAGDWESRQTVVPKNVAVSAVRARSIVLTWTPIAYTSSPGGYGIYAATSASGPFTLLVTTPDKSATTFTLDGLDPSTAYFVRVGSVTWANGENDNDVYSDLSPVVSATTTNGAPAPASVIVLTYPEGLYQTADAGGGSDRYVLTNVGDLPTTVTIGQEGDFFTQSATTVTLDGGSSERVDITGLPRPAGAYSGFVTLSGNGVPAGLRVAVRLLSTTPPSGTVNAVPSTNRIDVSATVDVSDLTGSVTFTNTGSGTLSGIVVSDVSWIIPPAGLVTIPPSGSTAVTFAIDRQKRPDAGSLSGAAVGTLSLVYSAGSGTRSLSRALDNPPPVIVSIVTVVDTVKPPTAAAGFGALGAGEVPLFLPGVGHLQGSVGLFLSDLSLINAYGTGSLGDVRMYYTPAAGFNPFTSLTTIGTIQPSQSVALADVVSSVYNDQQQGTLQIRSQNWRSLSINANIFNVTNVRGTYGSSIPVFRADRAIAPGASMWLTGIRRTDQSHTNILLQETSGSDARADLSFYDAAGNLVAAPAAGTSVTVPPFQLYRDLNVVPAGAVTAKITNRSDSTGRLVAYATPIDDLSGDFWTVADWNQVYGSSQSEPVIVPVAGSLRGANNNYFRTDVAVSNRDSAPNKVTIDFYSDGATPATRSITLAAGETRVLEDIVGSLYPDLTGRVGSLVVRPSSNVTVTSRTFATQDDVPGTFGTGVPVLPFSAALHAGQSRFIAGLEVASAKTIGARRPATFRTNVGLVEVGSGQATVRVTVIYGDAGGKATGTRLVSRDFKIQPHQLLLSNVTSLIADSNPNVGDLRNVQLTIKVVDGDGAIIAFTSSVDNGSADQVFRLE